MDQESTPVPSRAVVVILKDRAEHVVLPDGNITVAQPGLFIVQQGEGESATIYGMFPIGNVLGIYQPEGPAPKAQIIVPTLSI